MLIPKTILSWMKKNVTQGCQSTHRRRRMACVPIERLEDRTVLAAGIALEATPPSGGYVGNQSPFNVISYTITVSNDGSSDVEVGGTDIQVSFNAPTGTVFQNVAIIQQPQFGSAWSSIGFVNGATTLTCSPAGNAVGVFTTQETLMIRVEAVVQAGTVNGTLLTATANYTQLVAPAENTNSNDTQHLVSSVADLGIAKSAVPVVDPDGAGPLAPVSLPSSPAGSVVAGGYIRYDVPFGNSGPSDAINVLITDQIAGNTAFVGALATGVVFVPATQPPAVPFTFTIQAVDTVAPFGPNISLTATVIQAEGSQSIYVRPQGNAGVGFADGTLPADYNGTLTFFVRVNSSVSDGTLVGNPANITSGLSPNAAAPIFPPSASDSSSDSNSSNNTSLTTQTLVVALADLGITVATSNPTPVAGGAAFAYTIVVTNNGPSDALDVVVNDPLPSGVIFQNIAVVGPGAFAFSGPAVGTNGLVSCTSSVFPAGSVTTITIVGQIVANIAGGVRTNTATVTSATEETTPNVAPNTASVQVVIVNDASLSIAETGPAFVRPGDIYTYRIAVTNSGNSSALNVVVTDVLPANTTFLNLFGSNAFADFVTYNEQTRTVTATAALLATGTHIVDITVQLAPNAIIGPLTNSALLAAAVGTITGANPATFNALINGGLAIYGDQAVVNQDDVFRIVRNAGDPSLLEIRLNGALTFSGAIAAVPQISIFGLGGNDELIVDSTNGLINVANGIRYNGGNGFDKLTLTQTGGATQTSSTYDIGPGIGSGKHTIVGVGVQTVLFEELEPVLDSVPALFLFVNGTSEANAINYAQGAVATNGKVTVDSYESIEFSNKTALTINALAGSDSVSLNNASTPTGLTGITVNAGDPTGSDTLIVTGTGAADTFTFVGTSASSGTVARVGTPLVTFTGVEHTTLDGQVGDDTFKVGSDFGNVNIIGGDGSDTIDFSGSTKAVVFDMDLLNVAQRVSSGQEKVTLGEPIENFIGTDFNDIIRVQIAAFDRTINGGVETVIPPGDELIVDVQGHAPKITKVPNGKLGSFDGTVNATGYTGTISYFDIETLAIKNGPPTGGFGGAFAAATDYLVGKSPRGVALGQLNDDNMDGFIDDLDFLDMVVANADSRTVTVRMGEAFGLFGPATNYATGGKKPTTVQLADLDEDGTLDIALVNRDSNTLSVLLNDGTGLFGAFTLFSTNTAAKTGRQPYSVKLADVDGDTHIDAVIANAISGTVSVLLGVGDGTFGPARTFTTGGKGPRDLVIGDFNNDGFADLVTTNIYSKNASFLAGDGSGTFVTAPQLFAVGTEPSSIVAADFNADGNLDVAISNQRSNTVSILLGNGAAAGAQFREELRIHYPGNKYAISIAAGDFNGDGNVDLVVANQRGNTLSILLGLGNGSFTNPVNFSVGDVRRRQPVSVAVGDFNHDGFLDVLVANGGTNDVSVLLRNPIA